MVGAEPLLDGELSTTLIVEVELLLVLIVVVAIVDELVGGRSIMFIVGISFMEREVPMFGAQLSCRAEITI